MLLNQLSRALYEIRSTQKTNIYIYIYIYIYCFIPCLTRRKWGLRKYWSFSIQWNLYTNRVLATFFPCCNLSSRTIKISGRRTRWWHSGEKTAKHRQQITTVAASHQWVEPRFKHKSNLCPLSWLLSTEKTKLHVFSAGWLFSTFVSRCRQKFFCCLRDQGLRVKISVFVCRTFGQCSRSS